jgi:hypothetical protein
VRAGRGGASVLITYKMLAEGWSAPCPILPSSAPGAPVQSKVDNINICSEPDGRGGGVPGGGGAMVQMSMCQVLPCSTLVAVRCRPAVGTHSVCINITCTEPGAAAGGTRVVGGA